MLRLEIVVLEFGFLLFSGVQLGRPDLVPRTPPLGENPADYEANLSTSSLGSTGIASTSPPLRSVGVEVHKSANTEFDHHRYRRQ